MNNTMIGVDLAKEVIQVCIYTNQRVHSNKEMTHNEFLLWIFKAKPSIIIFEACGTPNYWKQKAIEAGHEARLISAKLVATVRQNQKTDKNDALAIVQAALLPEIRFVKGKSVEQQQLQSVLRLRELAMKQKTALNNQLKALLLEFNIRISKKNGGLKGTSNYYWKMLRMAFPVNLGKPWIWPGNNMYNYWNRFEYTMSAWNHPSKNIKIVSVY